MDLGGEGFWGQWFGLVKPRKEFWSFSWPGSDSHGVGERRRASPCPRVAGSSGEGRCLDDRLWRQPCSTVGINTGKVGVTGIGLVLGGAFDWGQC